MATKEDAPPWDVFGDDADSSTDGDDDMDDDGCNTPVTPDNNDKNKLSESEAKEAARAAGRCISLFLTKCFLERSQGSSSSVALLQKRIVAIKTGNDNINDKKDVFKKGIIDCLTEREFTLTFLDQLHEGKAGYVDAIVVLESLVQAKETKKGNDWKKCLVPGGMAILATLQSCHQNAEETKERHDSWMKNNLQLTPNFWRTEHEQTLLSNSWIHVTALPHRCGVVNTFACRSLKPKQPKRQGSMPENNQHGEEDALAYERRILHEVTLTPTASQLQQRGISSPYEFTSATIENAVSALHKYGFCILKQVFFEDDVLEWGDAAIKDLQLAIERLQSRGIDLLQPGTTKEDPVSYRELAMREDLRVDLRNGPNLYGLRKGQQLQRPTESQEELTNDSKNNTHGENGCASRPTSSPFSALRNHPGLLQILSRTLHPPGQHFRGNYGRWNFGGQGPDGTPPPLKISEMGSVVSLPGCGDQAMHADTPHLFECMDLPPHYVNLFLPAWRKKQGQDRQTEDKSEINKVESFTNEEQEEFFAECAMGGTAFLPSSHKLATCEELTADTLEARQERWNKVVRPYLEVGDAVLFDCRILHFGMANTSGVGTDGRWRPLLYVNYTHAWFHDAKNWDDREALFPELLTEQTRQGA